MNEQFLGEMKSWIEKGRGGLYMAGRYTERIDALMRGIFDAATDAAPTALIATGGYGRAELAPFSDIDIMFFVGDRAHSATAERALYMLWDTGLDISHSFRTAGDCIEEAFKDIRTRTSLLEARYIAGSRTLYEEFRSKVYPEIAWKRQKDFVSEKLREIDKLHSGSGDSVYLLEPNVKEGEGGLRDVHTAYWLSKVALRVQDVSGFLRLVGEYDYRRFLSSYDFLLRVRYGLHVDSGRRNDILSFEYQRSVAHHTGFRDSKKFSSAERLLRYYYLKSRTVREVCGKIIARCSSHYVTGGPRDMRIRRLTQDFSISGGSLIAVRDTLFAERPEKMIEAFSLFAKTGKRLSDRMKDRMKANLARIGKRSRISPEAVQHFLWIFRSGRIYETLREMHETGVLGRFVPEFGALRSLVVHEPYHMYTVDEHTLHAIRKLEELKGSKYRNLEDLHSLFLESEQSDSLFLSLLFHDIGKAAGRRHEEEGYKRLKNVMERFNLDPARRMRIEFLVRNHVVMSKTALGREADDTGVVSSFADVVGDAENLKALYLITYADMAAVNPGFWTSWKAYLLRELYVNTLRYLSGVRRNKKEYIAELRMLHPDVGLAELTAFLEEMPERYMLSTPGVKMIGDYRLVQRMRQNGFAMRVEHYPGGPAELSMCGEDRAGLFSRIVGFLSAKGLNIVNGRIFTGSKGMVIDRVSVSNWEEVWWEGFEEELEEGLKKVLFGGEQLSVVRREHKAAVPFELFIEIDNETSPEFTIIEVFSADRIGLLYDITNVLYDKGMNIISARINTESGVAQDIFFLQSKRAKMNHIEVQEVIAGLWTVLKGNE